MKNVNYFTYLLSILSKNIFTFIVFMLIAIGVSPLHAAVNDTCPGEHYDSLSSSDTSYANNFTVRRDNDPNDYVRIRIDEDGLINIQATPRNSNRSYNFSVSKTTCGGTDEYGRISGNTHSVNNLAVSAGEWVYIRIDALGYPDNNYRQLTLNVTWINPKETCPGTVIPNLDGTSSTANHTFSNETINYNKDYYYHFTPDVAGTFDVDTSSDRWGYHLIVMNGCSGGNLGSDTADYRDDRHVGPIPVNAGQKIVVRVDRNYDSLMTYDINFHYIIAAAPVMGAIEDQSATAYSPFSLDIAGYATGDNITSYTLTGALPAGLSFNTTNGQLTGTPTEGGSFNLSASATNSVGPSNIVTFRLNVTVPPQVPPVMSPIPNQTAMLNISYTLNLSGYVTETNGDSVDSYNLVSGSLPAGLSLDTSTGLISGTPTTIESQTIEVSATDGDGESNRVSFTIEVINDTDFKEGFQDFDITNPPNTRNIVGDYAMAGNTVMCLTSKTSSFGGTCTNSGNNNSYMGRYIDIDSDSGIGTKTFNSSSSNIILPSEARGVLWAGLFWQGNINGENWRNQRMGVQNGNDWYYQGNGKAEDDESGDQYDDINLDYETNGANRVLVKVGNDSDYSDVQAHTLYNVQNQSYGTNKGGEYAAYSDVTNLFSDYATMSSDSNTTVTVQVANISTNEGRTETDGVFGGWSLIVIYKSDTIAPDAKAKNITVYSGYGRLKVNINPKEPTINATVSGFKLPDEPKPISAQFAVFAGEGESVYSPDRLYIDHGTGGKQKVNDSNNVFDSRVSNIERDTTPANNNMTNLDSLDIDIYDVSDIMSTADRDISSLDLELYTNSDTIFPSMFAFSVELYKPNVCYDYVVRRNNFTIPSEGLDINSTFRSGDVLNIDVAIKSLENDFDLNNTAVAITMNTVRGQAVFDETTAGFSPRNSYIILPTDVTENSTLIRPEIGIGEGPTRETTGGTIGSFETYFASFNYDIRNTSDSMFEANLNIELNTTLDYGSGPVSQILPISQCPQFPIYSPKWLEFNIERHTTYNPTIGDDTDRYSLYTQIAGRDFHYSVVSYEDLQGDGKFDDETSADGITVDIELIDASAFDDNNSILKCSNPSHEIIIGGFGNSTFKTFTNGHTREPVTYTDDLDNTYALRSAAFRIWILKDENGTIIPHTYARNNYQGFKTIYESKYRENDIITANLCSVECGGNDTSSTECYDCLRHYFATPICSRDNFSIRPESFRVDIYDAGELGDLDNNKAHILKNSDTSTPANTGSLVTGYKYLMKARSTKDVGDITATGYYNDKFESGRDGSLGNDGSKDIALIEFADNTTGCNDQNHTSININFADGEIVDFNLSNQNAGKYTIWIKDNTWTKVDQARGNPNKTIFDPNCVDSSSSACNDCIYNNSRSDIINNKYGCQTSTDLPDDATYTDINVTYYPDHFNMTQISFIRKPQFSLNANSVYVSDLNQSQVMAASFEGNISAEGYNNNILSNFTDSCAANGIDVILDLNKTILTGTVIATDENGSTSPVNFQQMLLDIYQPINGTLDETDASMVFGPNNFEKNDGGRAYLNLLYNFKKPANAVMNPVDVNFTYLEATAPDANATAYAANSTIEYNTPDGNVTGGSLRFYYARVQPGQYFIDDIKEDFIMTSLSVQIYCYHDTNTTYCSSQGLGGVGTYPLASNESAWYSAEAHDGSVDGNINSLTVVAGSGTVTPNANVNFNNGSRTNIRVNHTGDVRPNTVTINASLDPWLFYHPNLPFIRYSVRFTADGNWAGVGNTGNVLDTKPRNKENNRVDW